MEKDKNKELWWSKIDDQLDAAEKQAFDKALQEDDQLTKNFEEARLLEETLRKMEPEVPSMRFSKNVMDQLPQLYKKIAVEPLFKKKSLTRAISGIIAVAVLSLMPGFFAVDVSAEGGTSNYWDRIASNFNFIASDTLILICLLASGIMLYMLLDQQLKKQLLKKNLKNKLK